MPLDDEAIGARGAPNASERESAPREPVLRVLLVEDDEIVRPLLAEWLSEAGVRVTSAGDGAAAVRLIEGGSRFDVLVTDLQLPGLDGIAVGRCWRRRFPGLPVIFVTAFVRNLLSGGAAVGENTALLAKPFRFPALLDMVVHLAGGGTFAMGAYQRAELARRSAHALSG